MNISSCSSVSVLKIILTCWTVVVSSRHNWMILFLVVVKSLIPVNGVLQTEEIIEKIKLIPGQDNKLLAKDFLMWPYNSKELYFHHCVSGVSESVVIKTGAGIKHYHVAPYKPIKCSQTVSICFFSRQIRTMTPYNLRRYHWISVVKTL